MLGAAADGGGDRTSSIARCDMVGVSGQEMGKAKSWGTSAWVKGLIGEA